MRIISGPGSLADPHTSTYGLAPRLPYLDVKFRSPPAPRGHSPNSPTHSHTPTHTHTHTTLPLNAILNLAAPAGSNSRCTLVATDVKISTFNWSFLLPDLLKRLHVFVFLTFLTMYLLLLFSFMFSIFDHSIQTEKNLIAQTLSGNLNMVA